MESGNGGINLKEDRSDCEASHENSIHDVPELQHRHYQRGAQWIVKALELGQEVTHGNPFQ